MSHHFHAKDDGPCLFCGHGEDHAIHTIADRRYLPVEWMDETVPELGNSPDDFLRRDAGGTLRLSQIENDEDRTWNEVITPGEIVGFMWTEAYEDRVLTWDADGNWLLDQPAPATANCFRPADGDYEDMWHDPAEMVRAALSGERDDYHSPMTLDVWGWQDAGKYRVKMLESGEASFEAVAADEVAS